MNPATNGSQDVKEESKVNVAFGRLGTIIEKANSKLDLLEKRLHFVLRPPGDVECKSESGKIDIRQAPLTADLDVTYLKIEDLIAHIDRILERLEI